MSEALLTAMQETAEKIAKQAKDAALRNMAQEIRGRKANGAIATEYYNGWNAACEAMAVMLERAA